jgi:hypothetical protein
MLNIDDRLWGDGTSFACNLNLKSLALLDAVGQSAQLLSRLGLVQIFPEIIYYDKSGRISMQ